MGILIGMDEAGYGPHLGPLVVAASAWYVPDEIWNATPSVSTARLKRREAATAKSADADGSVATAELNSPSAVRNSQSRVDLYRVLRNVVSKTANDRRIPI